MNVNRKSECKLLVRAISLRLQLHCRRNDRLDEILSNNIWGHDMDIEEKLDKRSVSSLRAPRASNLLIVMISFGLSIALVAYCFVNGHFFVGVWLATTFLAWAFLFGAANATDQLSCTRELDAELNPSICSGNMKSVALRGAAPKRRARARGLKTGSRATVKTRLEVGSPCPERKYRLHVFFATGNYAKTPAWASSPRLGAKPGEGNGRVRAGRLRIRKPRG